MSILDYFPQGYNPTPLQVYVLQEVERVWNESEVVVIDGAVALGKSMVAMTILAWNKSGTYVVPSLILLDQLEGDFAALPTLRARDSYKCKKGEGGWTCIQQSKKHGNCVGCPKVTAEIKIKTSKYAASTFMGTYSNKLYKDLMIVDECFKGNTEVLTEFGFKRFDELDKTELIAQVDSNTREISFVTPSRYIAKSVMDQEMVTLRSDQTIEVTATTRHEVLLESSTGVIKKSPIVDCTLAGNKMFKAGFATGGDAVLTPLEKLIIMHQADGCQHSLNKSYFSFSKQRKIDQFYLLMREGKFTFKEISGKKGEGNIKARRRFSVDVTGLSLTKRLSNHFNLSTLSLSKAKQMIEYMVHWDGYIYNKGRSYYYSCVDRVNTDFYQAVATLAGYKTKQSIQVDNRSKTYNDVYRLFITKSTDKISLQTVERTYSRYSGKVYCVTVPKGNIVIRENGKPLVIGNCHLTTGWLRGLQTKSLPKSTYGWPDPATPETMKAWVKAEKKRRKDAGQKPSKAITALESHLNGRTKTSIAYRVREPVNGYMDDVVKISPSICSGTPLWPGHKVSKVVLMSATLSDLDILLLGLNNKKVTRIVAGSPIPPQNRPVCFTNEVSVTWENREAAAWELAQAILRISFTHPNEAGIVPIPYSLAVSVGEHLRHNPRFIFHGHDDKIEKLNVFLQSGNGVFLASGFAEGLSLGYDKARFNVISKLLTPNIMDPFVSQMAEKWPTWLAEQGAKTLLQSYGRTTRRVDDFSMTYILDSQALNLYNRSPKLFPAWFHNSVVPFQH